MHDECCGCRCGACVFFTQEECDFYDDGKHRASAKMPGDEDYDDTNTWAVDPFTGKVRT